MKSAGTPIVIGVGEEFLHDDGAGPAVVAQLRELAAAHLVPPDTRLEVCFGEPTELIELWRDAQVAIVVDAAVPDAGAGLAAGEVVRWEPGHGSGGTGRAGAAALRVTAALGPAAGHALGPGAALALANVLDRVPERLVLYAVVGTDFSLGPGLSEPVARAVDTVAHDIADELRREGLSARSDRELLSWSDDAPGPRLKP
ncbi:hydrogenase maturation protease [Catenulispora sp. GP43]|uniref:hydrogenase maturation protease n=1 Tax=Catenulispora sp. GP43 TaxID=3156263 RepID=UPI0035197781